MKIETLLEKVGISGFEQEIYLTILKYKQIAVGKIAQLLNKPRSTIYSCIEKLKRNQFAIENKTPSGTMFSVRGSNELIALIEKRKKTLDSVINEIKQQEYLFAEYENYSFSAPQFFIHYGLEAIELIQSSNPKKQGYFIWDINIFQEKFQKSVDQIILNFFENQSYKSKSILVESETAKKYVKKVLKKYKKQHQFKFLPVSIKNLKSDTMLMDDKYIHISYKDPVTVMEVRDITFFETQKIMFEGLWNSLPEISI